MNWKNLAAVAVPSVALTLVASSGAFAGSLVTNGDFSSNTGGGQIGFNTTVTDWSTSGYNFLYTSANQASTTGVTGSDGNLQLWGPGNGSTNGLTDPPVGNGAFIAADGAFDSGPISQTINSLTVGETYQVGFYWGGAQQYTFDGDNTEQWVVSLGSETQSTAVYDNPSHGFSGWLYETMNFTATSTQEVLSFLAVGTPISPSVPPMSLLDGVTLNAVPEPSALMLMGLGLLGLGTVGLRQRMHDKRKSSKPAAV